MTEEEKEEEKLIHCGSHGLKRATFVCQHLLKGYGQGFFYGFSEEYPDDPFPDAWCAACDEQLAKSDGEWNDENEAFAGIKMICADCYLGVRLRNQPDEIRRRFAFSHLEDVVQTHKNHPRTFSIPRSDERENLKPGQLVKLHFHLKDGDPGAPEAERMWVEVIDAQNGKYRGELTNQPFFIKSLSLGDEIKFEANHVTAVYFSSEDEGWVDESKTVFCAEEILRDDKWPSFACRKVAQEDKQSGWHVYTSQEAVSASAMKEIELAQLLNAFPIFDSIASEKEGTTWVWNEEDAEYKRL